MKNYLTVLAIAATLTLFAGLNVVAERQIDNLSRQVDSLRAEQMAIKARQQGIYAVQGWQAAMYDQYLEMGRQAP